MSVGLGAAGGLLAKGAGHFFGQVAEDAEGEVASAVDEGANEVTSGSSCAVPRMSFSSDTPVATPSGEQPIAAVQVGQQVSAYDPVTGKVGAQRVEATSIHTDDNLVDVTLRVESASAAAPPATTPSPSTSAKSARSLGQRLLRVAGRGALAVGLAAAVVAGASATAPALAAPVAQQEVIHTTTNHPWLTADHGWLPASFLHTGESVVTLTGARATVVAVRVTPGAARMWDLTVSNTHTFAVGAAQVVVHNCGDTIESFDELTSKLDKNKEVVVVGRWMSRVHDMKTQLEGAGFKVRTWEIKKPATVENNYHWLWHWAKSEGNPVVDIGMPKEAGGDTGPFYGMEQSMLDKWESEGTVTRFRYNFGD